RLSHSFHRYGPMGMSVACHCVCLSRVSQDASARSDYLFLLFVVCFFFRSYPSPGGLQAILDGHKLLLLLLSGLFALMLSILKTERFLSPVPFLSSCLTDPFRCCLVLRYPEDLLAYLHSLRKPEGGAKHRRFCSHLP